MFINLKRLYLGLFILICSSSCQDWLDVIPATQIRAEEQFKSEEGFRDALIGIYINMTSPELYARDMTWNLVDLLSQQYATLPTLASYNEVQQYQYKSNKSMPRVDALWNKSYNVIANINNALRFIDKNKDALHPITFNIIKGELLGLRAFLHFDLMRLYGHGNIGDRPDIEVKLTVPYQTEFNMDVTPQLSHQETFELMSKDVSLALELLKEDPIYILDGRPEDYYDIVNRDGFYDNREQRMNYYAVKALQARMLLWQGSPQNLNAAHLAAQEVIDFSHARLIVSDNFSVSSDPVLYPEILFCLNVTAFANIVDRFLDGDNSTNYDALLIPNSVASEIYETSNVNIGLADIRYNTLLVEQARGRVSVKLRQRNSTRVNIMPLIKMPEMYYIVAEYFLSISDVNSAISYLNEVRSSRGIIEPIAESAEQEEVQAELIKEFRKEFISEGQLFFAFKRMGATTFPGLSENTEADDKIYVLPYPDSEVEYGNRIQF